MKSPLQGALFFIGLTEDDAHLPTPPVSPLLTSPPAVEAASEESDPYVPFTIQIRLSTFLKLRQAYHWEPGFGEMREHVNEAMVVYLAQLPGSMKALLEKEIEKNKILKKYKHLLKGL